MEGGIECIIEPLEDGLNFMSDAYFVKLKNETEEHNLFVKVPPQCNNLRQHLFEMFPEHEMFQKEFYFYNSVQNLFKIVIEDEEEDVKDILNFIPRSMTLPGQITFNQGLNEPLTFENLSASGYRMWKDEFSGLDLAHAGIGLETLGKMHALGIVLFEKKLVEDKNRLLDFDMMIQFKGPLLDIIDKGMTAFKDWMVNNNLDNKSIEKLEDELHDRNYLNTVAKLFKEGRRHELQLIQHGDARSNNMLFKYANDNTTPVEAKLVDYQMTIFFNPFFDLLYFLTISVSADVLIPNYHKLLNRYQSSLVSTLTRLNSKKLKPSVSYISKNIKYFAPMVLPHICCLTEVISGDGNPDLDPVLRQNKIRSAVELCQFFEII